MDLIAIGESNIGGEMVKTVNARLLHAFLEIGKDFSNWIKAQIERARLLENRDYLVFAQKGENPNGGRPALDYHLTIDAGKHVAMMSGTDKGFQVREYFIEVEKRLKSEPRELLLARAMIASQEIINEQRAELEAAKPKIEFHDAIVCGHKTFDFKETAKLISSATGERIGQKKLFALCREIGVLEKISNEPYQRHINSGRMVLQEILIGKSPWRKVHRQPRFTGKGLDWIVVAAKRVLGSKSEASV
jgi:phage anti-repressor protein